jgi:predicted ATPase
MKWIKWEGDLHSFVMWVYGPAGAGKSAIAQTIAEICDKEMILLATFFFSRNDPSRSNIRPLIATIAYQITTNLPDVRDAILGAIERDLLIFSKSLTVQLQSLIVEPLQPLIAAGFFHRPTSRRLVIIDGLDECSDPNVQRNIVEVLANSHRQYQLPLIFLFASRPEQHISLAFNTGVLLSVTTRIALDESYLPNKDIQLFLNDAM